MADINVRINVEDDDSLRQMNEEFYNLSKNTDKFGQSLEDIKRINFKQFALDMNRALAAGAEAIGRIAVRMASATAESAKFWRQVSIMSSSVGLAWREMDALGDAATKAGLSMDQIQVMMGRLATQTQNADGTLTKTGQTMQNLGIQVTDASGKVREMGPLFKDTLDAILKLESTSQKVDIFGEIFGQRNTKLIQDLIGRGAGSFEDIGIGSKILQDSDVKQLEKYNDMLIDVQDSLDDIKSKSASQFASLFGDSIQGFTTMLEDLVAKYPFLAGVLTVTGAVGGEFVNLVQVLADLRIALSGLNVGNFAAASGAGDLIGSAIGGGTAGAATIAAGGWAQRAASDIMQQQILENISSFLGASIEGFDDAMDKLVKQFDGNLSEIAKVMGDVVHEQMSAIHKQISMMEAIKNVEAVGSLKAAEADNIQAAASLKAAAADNIEATSGLSGMARKAGSALWGIATGPALYGIVAAVAAIVANYLPMLWGGDKFTKIRSDAVELNAKNKNDLLDIGQNQINKFGEITVTLGIDKTETLKSMDEFEKWLNDELDRRKSDAYGIWRFLVPGTVENSRAMDDLSKELNVIQQRTLESDTVFQGLGKRISSLSAELQLFNKHLQESEEKLINLSDEDLSNLTFNPDPNADPFKVLDDALRTNKDVLTLLHMQTSYSGLIQQGLEKEIDLYQQQLDHIESILEKRKQIPEASAAEEAALTKVKDTQAEYAEAMATYQNYVMYNPDAREQMSQEVDQKRQAMEAAKSEAEAARQKVTILKTLPVISDDELKAARQKLWTAKEELEALKQKNEELIKSIKLRVVEIEMSKNQQTIDEASMVENMDEAGRAKIAKYTSDSKVYRAKAKQIELEFVKDILEGTMSKEMAMRKRHIAMFSLKLETFQKEISKQKELVESTLQSVDSRLAYSVAVGNEELAQKLRERQDQLHQSLIDIQAEIASLGDPVENIKLNTMRWEERLRRVNEALDRIGERYQKIVDWNRQLASTNQSWADKLEAEESLRRTRQRLPGDSVTDESRIARENARVEELKAARAERDRVYDQVARRAQYGGMTPELQRQLDLAKNQYREASNKYLSEKMADEEDQITAARERNLDVINLQADALDSLARYYEIMGDSEKKFAVLRRQAYLEYKAAISDDDRTDDMIAKQEYQNRLLELRIDLEEELASVERDRADVMISNAQQEFDFFQAIYEKDQAMKSPMEVLKKDLQEVLEAGRRYVEILRREGKETEAIRVETQLLRMEKEKMTNLTKGQELLLASQGTRAGIMEYLQNNFSSVNLDSFTNGKVVTQEKLDQMRKGLGDSIFDTLEDIFKGDQSVVPNGQASKLQEALQNNILKTIEAVLGK